MKYFKKLVGDRIYLSPRNVEDAEIFVKWLNDFEVTDYTGRSTNVMDIEGEKEYLSSKKNNSVNFVIVKLENDEMIGTIGFDNIDASNYTYPPLTTFYAPAFDMGQFGAKLLHQAIKDHTKLLPMRIQLPCYLVERESCKTVQKND